MVRDMGRTTRYLEDLSGNQLSTVGAQVVPWTEMFSPNPRIDIPIFSSIWRQAFKDMTKVK